jgi:hypothetical protein
MTIPNIPEFPSIEELNENLALHKAMTYRIHFQVAARHVFETNLNKSTSRKPVSWLIDLIWTFMGAGITGKPLGAYGVRAVKSRRKKIENAIANVPTTDQCVASFDQVMKSRQPGNAAAFAHFRLEQVQRLLDIAAPRSGWLMRVFYINTHPAQSLKSNMDLITGNKYYKGFASAEFWDIADMLIADDQSTGAR